MLMKIEKDILVVDAEANSSHLFLLGDLHIDAETFKAEKLKKAAEITKGAPVIFLGDILDYGFFDNLLTQLRREKETTRDEILDTLGIQGMLAVDEVFDAFDQILAVCEGNHDIRAGKATGELFLKYACAKRDIVYARGQLLIRLRVGRKANGKKRLYRLLLTHGSRGGRRQSAPLNELEDLARTWAGVDLIAVGHHHKFVHSTITKTSAIFGELYTEITEVVSVPSFLGFEIYAQKRGYPPPEHAIVHISFFPREGTLSVQKISL